HTQTMFADSVHTTIYILSHKHTETHTHTHTHTHMYIHTLYIQTHTYTNTHKTYIQTHTALQSIFTVSLSWVCSSPCDPHTTDPHSVSTQTAPAGVHWAHGSCSPCTVCA